MSQEQEDTSMREDAAEDISGSAVVLSESMILDLSAPNPTSDEVGRSRHRAPEPPSDERTTSLTSDQPDPATLRHMSVGVGLPAQPGPEKTDEMDDKLSTHTATTAPLDASLPSRPFPIDSRCKTESTVPRTSDRCPSITVENREGNSFPGAFREGPPSVAFGGSVSTVSISMKSTGPLVSAFMVEEDMEAARQSMMNQIREEILQEAVPADSVAVVPEHDKTLSSKLWAGLAVLLLVVIILAVIMGVALGPDAGEDGSNPIVVRPTINPWNDGFTTLERVRERGYVTCGIPIVGWGFGFNPEVDAQQGINVEHCQAIALTALGDPSFYELTFVDSKSRFRFLANYSVDVLTTTSTITMGWDVYEEIMDDGMSFSTPFLYTGMAFGGVPEYVDCADNQDTLSGSCRDLRVCVADGSSHMPIIDQILPAAFVIRTPSFNQIELLNNGTCNVMARDLISLAEPRVRANGYKDSLRYKIGGRVFSREPLALATRQGDHEWTQLANSVIELAYHAEAVNMTSVSAKELLAEGLVQPLDLTTYDNNGLYDRMVRLVAWFGNYAELYNRTIEHLVPRDYPNHLHNIASEVSTRSRGLLYYYPFGALEALGPGPVPNGVLASIVQRGYLICGVHLKPGFAEFNSTSKEWSGLDVEFCKALNAAIHLGAIDSLVYVDVGPSEEDASSLLRNQTVDVVAGHRITLQKMLMSDLVFSTPYFYDNADQAFALATQSNDPQWSDFVYWIVMATIYAEEEGITMEALQEQSGLMPVVSLFGERFKPMLYDSISTVGSYKQIYERSLETFIPRSGVNSPNLHLSGPQQFSHAMI